MNAVRVPPEAGQLTLFQDLPETPDLSWYDWILVSVSGGKDSQTALRQVHLAAAAAGVDPARIVCVFADLGDDEWPFTAELAAAHAAWYGYRFVAVCREVTDPVTGQWRQQDLLEHIWQRGMWPDGFNRYCTSDLKRGPIRKLMSALAAETRAAGVAGRPARILSVMGMRAGESLARRKMVPFSVDEDISSSVRTVHEWLPIHGWNEEQVWADIAASRVPYHYAYDLGMPRLSCACCVLAGRAALVLAARAMPEHAARRVLVEAEFVRRRAVIIVAVTGAAVASGRPARWLAEPPPRRDNNVPKFRPDGTRRPLSVLGRASRSGPWFKKNLPMYEVLAEALAAGPLPPPVRGARARGEIRSVAGWSG